MPRRVSGGQGREQVAPGLGVHLGLEAVGRFHRQSPLHRVQLQDAWAVRPRYMLLREGQAPSPHVQALMDAIQAYHAPQAAPRS